MGGLCDACKEETELFAAEVKSGGIYWKCKDCESTGVIKATAEIAKKLRAKQDTDWNHTILELDKNCCPACREEE